MDWCRCRTGEVVSVSDFGGSEGTDPEDEF